MLIVLESIDGGGKGRQREEVLAQFKNFYPTASITGLEFPDKEHPYSIYNYLIHDANHGEVEINEDTRFLGYLIDKVMRREELLDAKGSKETHLICDGYYTTTLVYQCLVDQSISLEKACELGNLFKIPQADLNILLDVDVNIAQDRKANEEGHEEGLDRYESNRDKQKKIHNGFMKLVKNSTYGTWQVVNGNKTVEEVCQSIVQLLHPIISNTKT
jgi:thymidylate kinase